MTSTEELALVRKVLGDDRRDMFTDIQMENGCNTIVCSDPLSPHCVCMDQFLLTYGRLTREEALPSAGEMAAFGASETAGYLYPDENQQAERAAFCEGAAHAVSAIPPAADARAALEWIDFHKDDQNMNHVNFRIGAGSRANSALRTPEEGKHLSSQNEGRG